MALRVTRQHVVHRIICYSISMQSGLEPFVVWSLPDTFAVMLGRKGRLQKSVVSHHAIDSVVG